jgi:D-glycero-D-manno-heptose 1,7-bisphosphate phosphatase
MRRAVFLDRDGVINENRSEYVKSWDEFHFLPGALASLARLAQSPFSIVVVSNQSAINKGLVSWAEVNQVNAQMVRQVKANGGRIDGIYVCPHRPDEGCRCRKPEPGLLLQAAAELSIDLRSSFLVGDALADMQAGLNGRCLPLLVLTGRGQEELARVHEAGVVDFVYFRALPQVVDFVLSLPLDEVAPQPAVSQSYRLARAGPFRPRSGL